MDPNAENNNSQPPQNVSLEQSQAPVEQPSIANPPSESSSQGISGMKLIIPLVAVIIVLLAATLLFDKIKGGTVPKNAVKKNGIITAKDLPPPVDTSKCTEFNNLELAMSHPEVVCVLDLSGQEISSISAEIGKLKKLETINLKNSKISEADKIKIKTFFPAVQIIQ